MNRMTDACENITLPQTSFAGGNERIWTPEWAGVPRTPPPPGSANGFVTSRCEHYHCNAVSKLVKAHPSGVLDSVNFGCFVSSKCEHFYII